MPLSSGWPFGDMVVLRTNNREELRKRIKYNHLVANCVILYNVFEMSRILNRVGAGRSSH